MIGAMEALAQLDLLNLEPSAKTRLAAMIAALQRASAAKDLKIQALTLELAHLRRIRFGVKSEALPQTQRDLFQDTWNEDSAAVEAEIERLADGAAAPAAAKPKRAGAGRQPLPDPLPRIEHRHEPEACQCPRCGNTDLVLIGEDVTEQLDVEPARFFVHRHIRPQYACRPCETVAAAPVPPAIIDGGLAAVGLLAWVLIGKHVAHLPLYRLEQIAARDGVVLSRSTLADWVGRLGVALQPLADRLAWHLRRGGTLHADETPVAQLDPGSGKAKKAYLWAYRSNDLEPGPRIVVFDYRPGRGGGHARAFLGTWQGHLRVDDYAGYKALFAPEREAAPPCVELGCWAHARRKFFELHQANQSPMALEALRRIGQLYAVEAEARSLDIPARQRLRAERALPELESLRAWLAETRARTAPGTGAAKALDYTLKRWPALVRYAETGDLPVDNNPVENAIRPISVGKKNWLFAGSERAGQRAASIQTLLGTAKLNGLDPAAWLRDTLAKLPAWPNSRIDELLPFHTQIPQA
ncbi:Transposase [Methylomagnum ishizawai]|uniref:Transposase n=2 Tax=Methylomagnum ishizawai TaxID=1760988 RepID=A0A1Y6CVP6_9GAMM|nr:Transposase [Methylomagnum ishizawai]